MIYPFVCAFVRPPADAHTTAAALISAARVCLTRRWIETGSPQYPLTCVWVAASASLAESNSEPTEYSRCA
ncbi:MAG TPA: hypothetical protein VMU62_10630 [Acidobacteriaceae bacterium]|nr:hypothetical protein [Acidobacteriaceae bacterium]